MKNDVTIYVGIDFSKEKFNACLLMEQGVMGESEFPNSKTGYLKLTKWVKNTSELGRSFDSSLVLFCGEHTGTCSIGLCEYLYGKETDLPENKEALELKASVAKHADRQEIMKLQVELGT